MDTVLRMASRACLIAVIAAIGACTGSGAPTSAETAAQSPVGSYAEYAAASCAALQSLWRAYGNPETSEMSPLYRSFDAAVQAGDPATAATAADAVQAELERGRDAAAIAAGWSSGLPSAVQLDKLLRATQAMVQAKLAATPQGYREATDRGQAAFEAAGGIDAWYGMLAGLDAASTAAHQRWPACEGVPIG